MTIWIILASLVGVVAILIGFTMFHDRKKRKRLQQKKDALKHETELSRDKVVLFVGCLIEKNRHVLETFVPSIGKLKMADIRSKARESLESLTQSNEYKLLIASDEKSDKDFLNRVSELKGLAANNWNKATITNYFLDLKLKIEVKDELANYYETSKTKIEEIYVQKED